VALARGATVHDLVAVLTEIVAELPLTLVLFAKARLTTIGPRHDFAVRFRLARLTIERLAGAGTVAIRDASRVVVHRRTAVGACDVGTRRLLARAHRTTILVDREAILAKERTSDLPTFGLDTAGTAVGTHLRLAIEVDRRAIGHALAGQTAAVVSRRARVRTLQIAAEFGTAVLTDDLRCRLGPHALHLRSAWIPFAVVATHGSVARCAATLAVTLFRRRVEDVETAREQNHEQQRPASLHLHTPFRSK
jgi:hypothetical protein